MIQGLLLPGRDTDQPSVCGMYDQSYPCRALPGSLWDFSKFGILDPQLFQQLMARFLLCQQLASPFSHTHMDLSGGSHSVLVAERTRGIESAVIQRESY